MECYTILPNGDELGWQAKFFSGLDDPQWAQIDKSVKTSLNKHPRLVQYFICVPLDRPDARIEGHKSAMDRWNDRVDKWTRWASERGMSVEFVYCGSSELLEILTHHKHIGRLRFWFNVQGFDQPWFMDRLEEALNSAGPRYTPEIHVNMPLATDFEAFGRTDLFSNQIKAHARDIRDKLRNFKCSTASPTAKLDSLGSGLLSQIQAILTELGSVEIQPIGELPLLQIAEHIASANKVTKKLENGLLKQEQEYFSKHPETATTTLSNHNPFRSYHYNLIRLSSTLQNVHDDLCHAGGIAGRTVMIVKGDAGVGKTHLLCDISKQRLKDGRPTVLLMGQRFVKPDDPWTQVFQQLDLQGLSTEEFIGALEAAAQVADCRALVIIDAINEGKGREIWPNNLAAFVTRLEKSPWIGIIFSVRSGYENLIIPEEVSDQAIIETHSGFEGHEYDATKTFFIHYGIELPSTPLLAPEFSNPLFLKMLCQGLYESGKHQLPRGFHGITATFNQYLGAINQNLAKELGFNGKKNLVIQALQAITKVMVDTGEDHLTLEKAEEIVNGFLPGREYDRSLYKGLVDRGVLVEESPGQSEIGLINPVVIGYERFGDHLMAKELLDTYLDIDNPTAAFAIGGSFEFLCDNSHSVALGLLGAMCIQIPERIGKELVTLAPDIVDRWNIGDIFRQSLVWRDVTAFSEDTLVVLNRLLRTWDDLYDTFDVLLTVATIPDHPYNAIFLDQRLRKDQMPDRDAWWSIYLHHAWDENSAVDRMVDWAYSVMPGTYVENKTVELCAIVLSWMFTSSNRFLRDKATKALVNLLVDRLGIVANLIERFADVDDPYVTERVYAVAYGTAMQCHGPEEIATLAQSVYNHVFAGGRPPAHVLLRDYARGVVERALYLKADINVDADLIRPPYKSTWPTIPSEDDIKPLMPDWSRGSYDSGDLEWARSRIGSSVMNDDFARYVIGTNSSSFSRYWLSLQLEDPEWQSLSERKTMLLEILSDEEKAAWETFMAAENELNQFSSKRIFFTTFEIQDGDYISVDRSTLPKEKELDQEIERAENERKDALGTLRSVLSEEHTPIIEGILSTLEDDNERHPPRFDLRVIQRYILWRVFDLGWTTERFGKFDRNSIGYNSRVASKAERIGKKYQWIAYHEIMAYLSDHYQFRDYLCEEDGGQTFEGPWQNNLRDIDPSCTPRVPREGKSCNNYFGKWWKASMYDNWGDPSDSKEWVLRSDDLPKAEDLLIICNPDSGTKWLNLQGTFRWMQPTPPDLEPFDTERREVYYRCTGYFVHAEDIDAFREWGNSVNFRERGMLEVSEVYGMFLGEHGWSPASCYFRQQYCPESAEGGWTQPNHEFPAIMGPISFTHLSRLSDYDCSFDVEYNSLQLLTSELVDILGLKWDGNAGDYLDTSGQQGASVLIAREEEPDALLIREDILKDYLARENLALCWVIIGEKSVIGTDFSSCQIPRLLMSGAYVLDDNGPFGCLHCKPEEAYRDKHEDEE